MMRMVLTAPNGSPPPLFDDGANGSPPNGSIEEEEGVKEDEGGTCDRRDESYSRYFLEYIY